MGVDVNREPLAIRGAVTAAATAMLHLAVMAGWIPIPADVETQAVVALDLTATAVMVLWTRGKVTPVDDPRDATGAQLLPVGRHRRTDGEQ